MANANLKKAISILYDMELNDYYMSRTIDELNNRIDNLGYRKKVAAPVYKTNEFKFRYVRNVAIVVGVLFIIISVPDQVLSESTLFGKIMTAIFYTPFAFIVTSIIYGIPLGLLFGLIIKLKNKSGIKIANERIEEEYNKKLKTSNDNYELEIARKNILIKNRDSLIERRKKSAATLRQLYAKSGIDEKFRNIIAMGYMNEFITLGISDKLSGSDGLYYLILQELRWDDMKYTMNEISRKLDTIIDNQRALREDLIDMNKKSTRMINTLIDGVNKVNSSIERTNNNISELKAIEIYNGDRISKELEFQSYMQYMKF